VIQEAAEQSGRSILPVINPLLSFPQACKTSSPSIILWEGERDVGLKKVLNSKPFKNTNSLNVFVGPEGGFSPSEIEVAKNV